MQLWLSKHAEKKPLCVKMYAETWQSGKLFMQQFGGTSIAVGNVYKCTQNTES